MTGILRSAASCSCVVMAVPAIEAMTRSFAPLVIWFSIWLTCVGMSFSAYCRSTLYPSFSSADLMLSPSWIQRSDDFVGMVTPTRAPAALVAPGATAWSAVFWLEPHAESVSTSPAAAIPAIVLVNFIVLSSFLSDPALSRESAASETLGQAVVGLVQADADGEAVRRGVLVDHQQLDPEQVREVAKGFGAHGLGEHGVVRAAGRDPRFGGRRQRRRRLPHRPRHGQVGQRLVGRDDLALVGHQAEPVAEVDQAEGDAGAGRGVDPPPDGVLAAADAEGV